MRPVVGACVDPGPAAALSAEAAATGAAGRPVKSLPRRLHSSENMV